MPQKPLFYVDDDLWLSLSSKAINQPAEKDSFLLIQLNHKQIYCWHTIHKLWSLGTLQIICHHQRPLHRDTFLGGKEAAAVGKVLFEFWRLLLVLFSSVRVRPARKNFFCVCNVRPYVYPENLLQMQTKDSRAQPSAVAWSRLDCQKSRNIIIFSTTMDPRRSKERDYPSFFPRNKQWAELNSFCSSTMMIPFL